MTAPILPEEFQKEFTKAAVKYSTRLQTSDYSEALEILKNLYAKMLGWQKKCRKRLHKEYPLRNIGYVLYLQDKADEALEYFILAYIESLLSADGADEADRTSAGHTLAEGYGLSPASLEPLKKKVSEIKASGKIPMRPEEVIKKLEKSKGGYSDLKTKTTAKGGEDHPQPVVVSESPWGERVFVGESIGSIFAIKQIAETLRELGYDAIVCSDFEDPEDTEPAEKSLILLRNCKYAIFSIAEPPGEPELIEVKEASARNIKTLLIWQKSKEAAIIKMLESQIDLQKISYNSYVGTKGLKSTLWEFLPQKPPRIRPGQVIE